MLAASLRRLHPSAATAAPALLARSALRLSSSAAGGDTPPTPSSSSPPSDSAPSLFAASLASLAAAPSPVQPIRSILSADHGIADVVRDVVRGLRARAAVALTRTHLETSFDEAEFLEGSKDAFYMVNAAIGAADVRALRPAVSPTLLEGFKQVATAYDDAGLKLSLDVDPATLHAVIDDMALMNGASVASAGGRVDDDAGGGEVADGDGGASASQSARGASAHLRGMYQVLAVRFTGAVNVAVRRGGDLVQELTDRRPKTWRFVRGPLPGGLPARQLDGAPWTLLAID